MKTEKYRSLGLDVNIAVPESVEEFDANAKRAGACLDEATANVVYRGCLADFRDSFTEELEKETSEARKTKDIAKGDKTVTVFGESEAEYVTRVCAIKGWGENKAPLQAIADRISPTIVFDASATERKPLQPKKLPATYLEGAKNVLARQNEPSKTRPGKTTLEAVIEKLRVESNTVFALTGDNAKDADALGWAIKANEDAKRKAAAAEYASS